MKNQRLKISNPNRSWWLIFYLLVGIPTTVFDYEITTFLARHDIPAFSSFMDRSLFAGDALGFVDLFTISIVFLCLAYVVREFYYSGKTESKILSFDQPELGFITSSTLLITLAVHTIKYAIGRARPYLVLEGGSHHFTPWWGFGDHMPTSELIYSGSSPSGHAATVMASFSIAVLLCKRNSRFANVLSMTIFVLSLMMSVSRCMSRHHWISDSYIGFGVVWLVLIGLYSRMDWACSSRRYFEEMRSIVKPAFVTILVGAFVLLAKITMFQP